MFSWFKRKPKKWIGTITAKWIYTEDQSESKIFYHLYLRGNKRIVESEGLTPLDHPLYKSTIVPWLNNAPDDLLYPYVDKKLTEYWGISEPDPPKPEFKLLKFEKKPDESA